MYHGLEVAPTPGLPIQLGFQEETRASIRPAQTHFSDTNVLRIIPVIVAPHSIGRLTGPTSK